MRRQGSFGRGRTTGDLGQGDTTGDLGRGDTTGDPGRGDSCFPLHLAPMSAPFCSICALLTPILALVDTEHSPNVLFQFSSCKQSAREGSHGAVLANSIATAAVSIENSAEKGAIPIEIRSAGHMCLSRNATNLLHDSCFGPIKLQRVLKYTQFGGYLYEVYVGRGRYLVAKLADGAELDGTYTRRMTRVQIITLTISPPKKRVVAVFWRRTVILCLIRRKRPTMILLRMVASSDEWSPCSGESLDP